MWFHRRPTLLCMATAYLIGVHTMLALVLVKSDFLPRVHARLVGSAGQAPSSSNYYRGMVENHRRMDGQVPAGATVFIGDSITQSMYVDAAASPAVNYGIGADTTTGVLARIPLYQSLSRASKIVLAIGVNDLRHQQDAEIVGNYRKILEALPARIPVVVNAVLPVAPPEPAGLNARISALNRELRGLCADDQRCTFIDAGPQLANLDGSLRGEHHVGDGLHLSTAGYRAWISVLKPVIGTKQ